MILVTNLLEWRMESMPIHHVKKQKNENTLSPPFYSCGSPTRSPAATASTALACAPCAMADAIATIAMMRTFATESESKDARISIPGAISASSS